MGRIWGLAALVAGIWLLSAYGQSMPRALGVDAPATVFSLEDTCAVMVVTAQLDGLSGVVNRVIVVVLMPMPQTRRLPKQERSNH